MNLRGMNLGAQQNSAKKSYNDKGINLHKARDSKVGINV